jgi:hypothetical protein
VPAEGKIRSTSTILPRLARLPRIGSNPRERRPEARLCLGAAGGVGLTGAAWGEKYGERLVQRDSFPRPGVGDPRRDGGATHSEARKGSYFPGVRKPRRLAEKARTEVVQEACIHRVLTRWVDKLVRALVMASVSKCQVNRLRGEIDGRQAAVLDRSLECHCRSDQRRTKHRLWTDARAEHGDVRLAGALTLS